MPTVKINGEEHEVEAGKTVLQACEQAGVEIPRFCYHERLSIAGNCRMCLVEVKPGPPKPQASCALPVQDGQEIQTESDMVQKARKGVMEFLLVNHPLDCPICDQGGECDLQDQSVAYGFKGSRYEENKRAVADKYMGPLINTVMTRCIHCTRCVRFISEVAGVEEIGLLNRGENAEISSLEKAVDSEMSANVIDLCPVGALTSKPYQFEARPWELKKTESVDVLDAVGSNIRIDARGNAVLRVLPRLNEEVNEEWISDKTRYACDGLSRQRLDQPYVRGADGKLHPADWPTALKVIGDKVAATKPSKIAAIAGDLVDVESVYALKGLMDSLGVTSIDCRQDGAKIEASPRAQYLFNTGIAGIEEADALLIVGANVRWEAPLVSSRIRKRWLTGGLKVAAIGEKTAYTFDVDYLGAGPETLNEVAKGKHAFAKTLKEAKNPMIIIGSGALARADGADILATVRTIADDFGMVRDDWNGFNVLHRAASRVGAMDVGFLPGKKGKDVAGILKAAKTGSVEVVYLHGADEIDTTSLEKAFVIYQGHHGDRGAHAADVILPGAAYTEKNGTYVNMEGRVQLGRRAVFPPGEAREDWAIIRALSEQLGKPLPYNDLAQLRQKMRDAFPHLTRLDHVEPGEWGAFGGSGEMDEAKAFTSPIENFYMTDPISRASQTMADCTQEFVLDRAKAVAGGTGTNG